MFEVGGTYSNRKGIYTVLALGPTKMRVKFEDGSQADLNIDIQERIWQNIVVEQEARSPRKRSHPDGQKHQFYVYAVSEDELTFPGSENRIGVFEQETPLFKPGDRIMYYALDLRVFFAVVTITGEAVDNETKNQDRIKKSLRKKYGGENIQLYPIDIELQLFSPDGSVAVDAVELESYPNFRSIMQKVNDCVAISEDDFELIVELLSENEDEEIDEDDLDPLDEDELDLSDL